MSDLTDCSVVLADHTDQVQIDKVKSSRIFVGACSESVFVRNCEDTVFFVVCKQLRTRDCTNCTFYLHCKTEPVVETSTKLAFASFKGGYSKQVEHMKSAGLDPDLNLWWGVYDFNDPEKNLNNWSYVAQQDEEEPWFVDGQQTEQVLVRSEPGSCVLPSQLGEGGGSTTTAAAVPDAPPVMSFRFDTTQAQATKAHDALVAPPPPEIKPPPTPPPVPHNVAAPIPTPPPPPPQAAAPASAAQS